MRSTATLATAADVQSASRIRRFAVGHPVGAYLLLAYPIGWSVLIGLTLVGVPIQLSLPATTLVGIAAPAVLITYWGSGWAGVRRLLSGVLRWRIGFGRLAFVAGAMPAMTPLVDAATGTIGNPNGGWGRLVLTYLVGLVVGAVGTNIWEELAWSGLEQRGTSRVPRGAVRAPTSRTTPALCSVPSARHKTAVSLRRGRPGRAAPGPGRWVHRCGAECEPGRWWRVGAGARPVSW
jgi:hypothetical protein